MINSYFSKRRRVFKAPTDFPLDCFFVILEFISSSETFFNVLQCSKRLNSKIMEHPDCLRNVKFVKRKGVMNSEKLYVVQLRVNFQYVYTPDLIEPTKWFPNVNYLDMREYLFAPRKFTIKNIKFGANLIKLDLRLNKISKIEGLEKLTKLTELNIYYNRITKIEGLEKLTKLTRLDIGLNRIQKIEGLEKLTKLTKLGLSSNKISKIEGLENLTKLTKLGLSSNKIVKIEGLENLTKLTKLDLSSNKIEGLENLTKLTKLDIELNRIQKIEGLEKLTKLTKLYYNWSNFYDYLRTW